MNSISKEAKNESLRSPNTIISYNDDNGILRYAYKKTRNIAGDFFQITYAEKKHLFLYDTGQQQ